MMTQEGASKFIQKIKRVTEKKNRVRKEPITLKIHLLGVRIPDTAYHIDFYYDKEHDVNVLDWKEPIQHIGSFIKDSGHGVFEGDNEWELLGVASELTEEQCMSIVNIPKDRAFKTYKTYWLEYLKENKVRDDNGYKWVLLKKKK